MRLAAGSSALTGAVSRIRYLLEHFRVGGSVNIVNRIVNRVWTVAEAKARLSEVLRLAEEEGPQRIGIRKPFVVVPAAVWEGKTLPRKPLGQLAHREPATRHQLWRCRTEAPSRQIPFIEKAGE